MNRDKPDLAALLGNWEPYPDNPIVIAPPLD